MIGQYSDKNICSECLGRKEYRPDADNLTNHERGEKIRKEVFKKPCYICFNFFSEISEWHSKFLDKIGQYNSGTSFIISIKDRKQVDIRENKIWNLTLEYDSLTKNIKRSLGNYISLNSKYKVDFDNPSFMIVIDLEYQSLHIESKSIFLYSRYIKNSRDLYQSPREKFENISDIIRYPCKKLFNTKKIKFHAAGREDFDVKCIEDGRPFALEIINPRISYIPEKEIQILINQITPKVQVKSFKYSTAKIVPLIKGYSFTKKYIVNIALSTEREINCAKLQNTLNILILSEILQNTPVRVVHRRADLQRKRKIYSLDLISCGTTHASISIHCESGLYIKELITGDQGRTTPSLSELYGSLFEVSFLDVISVDPEKISETLVEYSGKNENYK